VAREKGLAAGLTGLIGREKYIDLTLSVGHGYLRAI
jgi:hypothetical protein